MPMKGRPIQTDGALSAVTGYTGPLAGPLVPFFIFMLPVLNAVEIPLVGRLLLGEAVCALLLPVLLLNRGYLLGERFPRLFLSLAFVWLGTLALTDIARGTPFQDYARGWAKIGFFVIDFCVLYILVHGRSRYIFLLACGLAVGSLADYVLSPYPMAAGAPWKMGIGPGVNLLAIIAISYLVDICWKKTGYAVLLLISVFNLYMGYRSAGGLLLLTLMYLLISPYLRSIPKRVTPFILLMAVFISFAVSLQMIDKIGRLEEKKSLLVKQRSQMGTFGLILGGRPELYTAALAIWDSPVFGHGSWARDKNYVYHLLDLRQYGYNINVTEDKIKDEYIPSHSYLLGAWVEAGIAGAVFWLAMLFLVARTLIDMTYVKQHVISLNNIQVM